MSRCLCPFCVLTIFHRGLELCFVCGDSRWCWGPKIGNCSWRFHVFEAALCGAGFLHVRRTPSKKACHCLLLPCFCYSKQKVLSRNTRKTAFEIPFFRLDNLMSMRSCLLTRRIKESGMDEIDEMKIGWREERMKHSEKWREVNILIRQRVVDCNFFDFDPTTC